MKKPDTSPVGSPAYLVAIIVAARRAHDAELERESRRLLEEQYGVIRAIYVPFARVHGKTVSFDTEAV
jgi:hypothetical protein